MKYELPDGDILEMGEERYSFGNILFNDKLEVSYFLIFLES